MTNAKQLFRIPSKYWNARSVYNLLQKLPVRNAWQHLAYSPLGVVFSHASEYL